MTDIADQFFAEVIARLETLRVSLAPAIASAVEAVLDVAAADGRVYLFGTGHSHALAEEAHYRAGGLALTVPILSGPTTVEDGAVAGTVYERMPGIVEPILDRYGLGEGDMLVVISNSGVNAAPVEAARIAKARGAVVVALTSDAYSRAAAAGRERIADIADIVLDNGGPPGDAVLSLPGTDLKAGPVSTALGATILHAVFTAAAARLAEKGQEAPVYLSANMPGAEAVNRRLVERYRSRNPHL